MKAQIPPIRIYFVLIGVVAFGFSFLYFLYNLSTDVANIAANIILIVVPLIVIFFVIPRGNISFVLWLAVSMVGIFTIFLSVFTEKVTTFYGLLDAVHATRLPDLYLLAVILSATATADAYELACTPGTEAGGQRWAALFALNLLFLICTTFLTSRFFEWCGQGAHASETQTTLLLDPEWTVWIFVFISLSFGAIFKYNLGKNKEASC